MAIHITFYSNEADPRELNKAPYLTQIAAIIGEFKDIVSVEKPTILIEGNQLLNANYIYIQELQRYYFINEPKLIRGNMFEIECSEDYLYSWKTRIENLDGLVTKQENPARNGIKEFIKYPQDVPIESDDITEVYDITSNGCWSGVNYYVTVNGGLLT